MCDCKTGPGKFEGEPALAFILHYDGFPDEQTSDDDFTWSAGLGPRPTKCKCHRLWSCPKGRSK